MKPLAGIRILDFSRVLAGPMATQILAELGAEVTKIERPRTGDESRSFEPKLPAGESAYFFAFNRAKRSMTLNLKSPRGQEIARALAAEADVVLENFLPGDMERLGLGYARLAEANPRLIYVSNTGFGQTGPYRDRKGYDTIFQALSGVMALTGHPDAPPAKVGVPFADLTSGLWIAIAILTSLVGRGVSGRGCHVDLAMMDAQVSLLTIAAARLFALDEDPRRCGTEHPGRVPSAAFACRDGGWLHVSGSDQHWAAICAVLGLDDLAADPRLASNEGRVAERQRVMARMKQAIGARDRGPLAEALRAADVPAGEVNSVREILEDPHTHAREMVGAFDHPSEGRFPALRNPLRFDGFDDPQTGTPPLLGSDTAAILASTLGLDEAEIAALRKDGVV
ncbi:MAG: CoA transferase [Rhizobiales bacterium]|nr:CoA transferase [Hyphomicrobiales bacterium]